MNGAGVGSTFIVQLPVQAGGKVEPQIMTNRAHSVTFGSDAEVIQAPPPPCALPCGPVSPQNDDVVIVDVAPQAHPSDFVLLAGLWQSASLEYRPSVASCCCCSRSGYSSSHLCCVVALSQGRKTSLDTLS